MALDLDFQMKYYVSLQLLGLFISQISKFEARKFKNDAQIGPDLLS